MHHGGGGIGRRGHLGSARESSESGPSGSGRSPGSGVSPLPVAIVTGAGRGIGRAICIEQARRGWRLLLVARSRDELAETCRACQSAGDGATAAADRYQPLILDLMQSDAPDRVIAAAIEAFGRIDALVNNAGIAPMLDVQDTTPGLFRQVIELDLTVPFLLARAVWPVFGRQDGGVIINISSEAARDPFAGFAAYGAAKAALNNLSLGLAREGEAMGIRVHAVAPGAVETPLLRSLFTPEQVPPEKALSPQDVADVVAQCLAGEPPAPSGQVIWIGKK